MNRLKQKYNRYELYEASVQDPQYEVYFYRQVYRKYRKCEPYVLREDFAATFLNSVHWIKQGQSFRSFAVDKAQKPLNYGLKKHSQCLTPNEMSRISIVRSDVISVETEKVDIVGVANFSICYINERKALLQYFCNARKQLKSNGVMILDLLGGTESEDEDRENRKFKFNGQWLTYHWEQKYFNPINRRTLYCIHYTLPNGKKISNVFKYPWRMWTITEITDAFIQAGFKKTIVYWEGENGHGGDGVFKPRKRAQNDPTWLAYVVALK